MDLKILKEGSRFEVFTRKGPLKGTLKARVTLCSERKTICWKGVLFAIPFESAFYLHPTSRGCRVECRISLTPFWQTFAKTTRLDRRWNQNNLNALKGLKALAERM